MSHNQASSQTSKTAMAHVKSGSRVLRQSKLELKHPLDNEKKNDNQEPKRNILIHRHEIMAFFKLFDDNLIQDFLWTDSCCMIADKYLLAMTFVYFKRAEYNMEEYTRSNFFVALYLAHTMEEDYEDPKYEIFPWALGENWQKLLKGFLRERDQLWSRIYYRACVSRRCCDEIMAIVPAHYVWQRERSEQHGGALRIFSSGECHMLRGPCATPQDCSLCGKKVQYAGLGLSVTSSSSSDPISATTEQEASHNTLDSPEDNMLIASSEFYYQDKQVNGKTSQCMRPRDTSMDWFTSSED